MKMVELSEKLPSLKKLIEASQNEDLVFVKNGKPLAILEAFDADDLEDWKVEHDPKLIARSEESRKQVQEGRFKTLEQVKALYRDK